MTDNELQDAVIEVAAKACKVDPAGITMDTRWKEDLNVKSVFAMKICALVKMKTGADINPADLATNKTIADTVAMIKEAL